MCQSTTLTINHSVTEAYSKKIELIFVDLGLFFNRFTNVLPRDSRQ